MPLLWLEDPADSVENQKKHFLLPGFLQVGEKVFEKERSDFPLWEPGQKNGTWQWNREK